MSRDREPVPLASWLTPAAAHAAILGGMLVRLAVYGPVQAESFRELHVALPAFSQAVIGVSTWLSHYWWVAGMPVLTLVVANAVVLWRLGGWRARLGRLWAWGVSGSLFSLWVAVEMGFLLPMLKMAEGLDREP